MDFSTIYKLAEEFEDKVGQLTDAESEWLKNNPAKYVRTNSNPSKQEIIQQLKKNPLKWERDGLSHTIDLLQQLMYQYRLKRKDTSKLVKTISYLRSILQEI